MKEVLGFIDSDGSKGVVRRKKIMKRYTFLIDPVETV